VYQKEAAAVPIIVRVAKQTAASLALLVAVLWPAAAHAMATPTLKGITLSPTEQSISVASTDVTKSFDLTLTNHTASLQELNLSARDFGTLNDTGGVFLEGSNNYTQKYGLASWMTLDTDTVTLNPGESQVVPVTINNRPDLEPGGHYGAVVVSVNSLTDQSGNKVAINQQLLSLILVDKVGGEHFDLRLVGEQNDGNWLHVPQSVTLRFQNPGNVQVVPRGLVKLESPSGTVVAQGIINDQSAFVLPQSFRELYVPLTKVGSAVPLPGLYHLAVSYRYDQITSYATKNYAVNFIDLGLYLLIALIVIVGIVVARKRHKKSHKKSA
jgi:hypothetical protein